MSRPLKLSTVSTVTIVNGSWFHCMIVRVLRGKKFIYIGVFACLNIFEPRHEKTNILHMRKQRRRYI